MEHYSAAVKYDSSIMIGSYSNLPICSFLLFRVKSIIQTNQKKAI